jgi:hypothetical protein
VITERPRWLAEWQKDRFGSRQYRSKSRQYGSKSRQYGSKSRQYGSKSRQYGPKSRQYGSKSRQYGSKSRQYVEKFSADLPKFLPVVDEDVAVVSVFRHRRFGFGAVGSALLQVLSLDPSVMFASREDLSESKSCRELLLARRLVSWASMTKSRASLSKTERADSKRNRHGASSFR